MTSLQWSIHSYRPGILNQSQRTINGGHQHLRTPLKPGHSQWQLSQCMHCAILKVSSSLCSGSSGYVRRSRLQISNRLGYITRPCKHPLSSCITMCLLVEARFYCLQYFNNYSTKVFVQIKQWKMSSDGSWFITWTYQRPRASKFRFSLYIRNGFWWTDFIS